MVSAVENSEARRQEVWSQVGKGCGSKQVMQKGLLEKVMVQKNVNYSQEDYAYIASISSKTAEAYLKG